MAPELGHAHLEGDPCPGRSLLENHREALAPQGLVRLARFRTILDHPCQFKETDEIRLHV